MAALPAAAGQIVVSTPSFALVLDAPVGGELRYLYYGTGLSEDDLRQMNVAGTCHHVAYPSYGIGWPGESALRVRHADGAIATRLYVQDVEVRQEPDAMLTLVKLKDCVYPFYVNLCYKAYRDVDVIETWTEFSHSEKTPVTLLQFASSYLPLRRGDVWLSSLYGGWGNEARLLQEPLKPGIRLIKNIDGVRNSHTAHAEVMFSLDGKPQENTGRTIGAALCYTGDYRLKINTDDGDYHHFFAGMDEEGASFRLKKGEVFRTPPLALTYSEEGLGGASRNFHKWGRKHKLANGDKPRKILLNSWEGVYFDINQKDMEQMMADIALMGGELFVMDDGWFGDKHPRDIDNAGLGDWVVNPKKLPDGIAGLLRDAAKHNIGFGIWIEPEMINTRSELYEKHPDWVMKVPGQDFITARGGTQAVLDLTNPQVRDFIFYTVDTLLARYPEIEYIKWDANMPVLNHGSVHLDKDEQSHLSILYHQGFEDVCRRIRRKYPDVTIQACASGGGRVNYGYLPYFDEFWTSDNTDALQRVYIQWGTSYFFPAIAMGSHISAAPNHQTHRSLPLKYRIDVAMSGRLGMEIQPRNMTDEEKNLLKKEILDEIKASSQGVLELEKVTALTGVNSLPAMQGTKVVLVPLPLLSKPAEDAAAVALAAASEAADATAETENVADVTRELAKEMAAATAQTKSATAAAEGVVAEFNAVAETALGGTSLFNVNARCGDATYTLETDAGGPLERLRQRLGRRKRVQRDGAVTAGERLLYACDGPCCRGAGEGAGARSCPDVRRQRRGVAKLPVHRRHAGRLERHSAMAGVRQRCAERHGERRGRCSPTATATSIFLCRRSTTRWMRSPRTLWRMPPSRAV